MKFVKYGYGRATDHSSKDILTGYMTRKKGIEMVKKHDHILSKDLFHWLKYVNMNELDFHKTADKFRSPKVWWIKNGKWFKDNIWGSPSCYGEVYLSKKDKKKFGDFGLSHHSTSLINLPEFKEFSDYIKTRSLEVLDHIGYDLKEYNLQLNNLWVQEFAEKGGGHHESHVHYNNHLSGFYFLKCSNKTSFPIFHDPRPAKIITQLPLKNANEISLGSEIIHSKPKPGTFIIFPAFLNHQFALDFGIEPFRFIHFNVQAVLKNNL
jgi:uncharacterized protein (TIGR02466 family)